MASKLLFIEDHPAMLELVATHLRERGYTVDVANNGSSALSMVSARSYDVAVLDLGLPDMDGLEVLRHFHASASAPMPVLILTARDGLDARIGGLDEGADDYLVKPFALTELEARLRAILRRPGPRQKDSRRWGDVVFNAATRTATLGHTVLDLTRRETAVLEELVRAEGGIVVKDVLEDKLYGTDETVSGNAVEAAVSRLRRKLAAHGSVLQIESVRGIGYKLKEGACS
jgi:two-component system, OmpR family, response regulator QseB